MILINFSGRQHRNRNNEICTKFNINKIKIEVLCTPESPDAHGRRTKILSSGLIDSLMECKWTMVTSNCSKCTFEYYSLTSGIRSVINESGFNIFPNPARSEITIYFRQFTQPKTVVFYDNVGRMVKSEKLYSDKNTLSVSELSPGIYFFFK